MLNLVGMVNKMETFRLLSVAKHNKNKSHISRNRSPVSNIGPALSSMNGMHVKHAAGRKHWNVWTRSKNRRSNDGKWDWDYFCGTKHFLEYVEFIFYLKKYGYDDYLTSDTSPTRWDIIGTFEANSRITSKIWTRLDSIDLDEFDKLICGGDFLKTWQFIESQILGL